MISRMRSSAPRALTVRIQVAASDVVCPTFPYTSSASGSFLPQQYMTLHARTATYTYVHIYTYIHTTTKAFTHSPYIPEERCLFPTVFASVAWSAIFPDFIRDLRLICRTSYKTVFFRAQTEIRGKSKINLQGKGWCEKRTLNSILIPKWPRNTCEYVVVAM